MITRQIYCCDCGKDVSARLTDGREIYPHRPDLHDLPFWKCDSCRNTVGCHHKTADQTRPLGVIPSPEIKAARQRIHRILDPLWQSGGWSRKRLYAEISRRVGWDYHTAEVRSVEQAEEIIGAVKKIKSVVVAGHAG